jgi:large subunit ribosomal protein L25
MSAINFVLEAESRTEAGKGASRRLRHADKVPAIMYGGEVDPQPITLSHSEVMKALEHEAFYSHILTVNVDGKANKAVLRDVQRHPYKPIVMHMDLQRVSDKDTISMKVPLHFIGEDVAPGVKIGGGIVSHTLTEVEISCQAKNLPEYIEVDLSQLEVDHSFHLSEIQLPEGVTIVALMHGEDHDLPVASIHVPRGAKESADEGEGEAAEGGEAAE